MYDVVQYSLINFFVVVGFQFLTSYYVNVKSFVTVSSDLSKNKTESARFLRFAVTSNTGMGVIEFLC